MAYSIFPQMSLQFSQQFSGLHVPSLLTYMASRDSWGQGRAVEVSLGINVGFAVQVWEQG